MKALMLLTGSGPVAILTSHESATDPALLTKLAAKGIDKFVAYGIPLPLAERRYGGHFKVVVRDLHESDDLRVLDYNGNRCFRLFHFSELEGPVVYEAAVATAA